mgnify:FL=1
MLSKIRLHELPIVQDINQDKKILSTESIALSSRSFGELMVKLSKVAMLSEAGKNNTYLSKPEEGRIK